MDNILSLLKPTANEIINVVLQFPVKDQRREQLWSLIIKDEDLTRQLLKDRNNAKASIPH